MPSGFQWESIGVRFHARGDTIELASSMGCHHGNQSGEEAASESVDPASPGRSYDVSFLGIGGGDPSNRNPPFTCLTLAAG